MSAGAAFVYRRDHGAGLERAAAQLLLGVLPAAVTAWLAVSALRSHWVAFDFYRAYYPAAQRLLHGGTPYAAMHSEIVAGTAFVYPALSAVAFTPFALIGRGLSDHLYTLLCFLLVVATLWTVRVRDWRVYGSALLWFPVIIGWQGENVSVPLTFFVALAWRHRDRPLVLGVVTAAAISLKPFVWPLALWLLVTRRFRAAAWMLVSALAFNALAWGLLGFDQIHAYLHLSSEVTDALWRGGYGMLAAAHHLGFGRGVGDGLLVVASVAVALAMVYEGVFRCREREAMIVAVALMLVASPLVWIHYFVLLLVPLALSRPRFGPIWLVPIAMWLLPPAMTVTGWQLLLAWGVVAACVVAALRGGHIRAASPA
jgi:alpha-1,2-mannosyltransferase